MSDLRAAVAARRSYSRVTDTAPTHEALLPLIAAAARVADHGALRPWRIIELRGGARARLGAALVEAAGETGHAADKLATKPLRAPLLLAIVASRRPSEKVPDWEQDAVASGVAHLLSLLLDDAGWGVMWRTGSHVRADAVERLHALSENESLLGWLYVGGVPSERGCNPRKPVDAERYLSGIDGAAI